MASGWSDCSPPRMFRRSFCCGRSATSRPKFTRISMAAPHRVVIVGAGFGGVYAAQPLKRAPVELTVIDRRNFHLFQPLLYQVATGGLSPGEIASPLRHVLSRNLNTTVWLGEVTDIDAAG